MEIVGALKVLASVIFTFIGIFGVITYVFGIVWLIDRKLFDAAAAMMFGLATAAVFFFLAIAVLQP